MEIGLYGVCTDETLRPDEMARLIEDAGFDALAIGEHTHIPVEPRVAVPRRRSARGLHAHAGPVHRAEHGGPRDDAG